MTGDKDRKWISGQGGADSAGCQRTAEKPRDKTISTYQPTRYAILGTQHPSLKVGTEIHAEDFQGEMDIFTMKERLD
jgi:hypothetical protein